MKSKTEILSLRLSNNEIPISKFELELYVIDEENQLFQDLIQLNFRSKYIYDESIKIITKHISPSEIAKYKLNQLLGNIVSNSQKSFQSLLKTYDLRCKGYWFLEEIGMYLALTLISSKDEIISDIKHLPKSVKEEYHKTILPQAISEATRIQNLLNTKEIIVTGETKGPYDRMCWIDNRSHSKIEKKELETIQFY
jgi:hypothetical protein